MQEDTLKETLATMPTNERCMFPRKVGGAIRSGRNVTHYRNGANVLCDLARLPHLSCIFNIPISENPERWSTVILLEN